MIRIDDRTSDQKQSHSFLIVGTDSFMSGWGQAKDGLSYAAWACRPEHKKRVTEWVERRPEMKRVRLVLDNGKQHRYYPKGPGHLHIYVVEPGHPALT